jgi:Uma2 family endonuclease
MSSPVRTIPPLRDGDRLSREEFELRYLAMSDVKKAELIDGVVHMPSPVRILSHATPHFLLGTWLTIYFGHTPGTLAGGDATTRLDLGTEPQPDGILMKLHGGNAHIDADDYIAGSPELVAEIASSTASIDRGAKLLAYQRNRVQEYVLFLMHDHRIEWYTLRQGIYHLLPANDAGILQSQTFPGLWLDPAAFLALDVTRVLAVLQQGLASPEHAAFVTHLAETMP